ncbi:bcl-2-related ovarian killer protein homolog A-like [Oppia nitens]|uniref:bcl-2-related ovarian killer protein homolog A-like n=1 Tax=Oppia nitens TaxID=1686743 RepID=UPI0023DAB9C6|nr:bcl-2-related ovarian killer protein homolog A-like [Oppia nitens]
MESCEPRKSFQSTILDSLDLTTHKKRLSQVGIAVSHHLTSTIGLKPSHSNIVKESKCLCSRFIRFKLRKSGIIDNKRFNLQKLRNLCNITVDSRTSLVANQLKCLVLELETNYPKLYNSVLNNITSHPLKSVNEIQSILQIISQELFRNDITWARIAALFAITGALAVDCVQVGHPEYILPIIDTFTAFVDRDIAGWIAQQGGWA